MDDCHFGYKQKFLEKNQWATHTESFFFGKKGRNKPKFAIFTQ
jgi:hypothetical protein